MAAHTSLTFQAVGDTLSVDVDGVNVLQVQDSTFTSGMVGLGACSMGRTFFGKLHIPGTVSSFSHKATQPPDYSPLSVQGAALITLSKRRQFMGKILTFGSLNVDYVYHVPHLFAPA